MATLIKNGTLVTPQGMLSADILIDNQKIAQLGPAISVSTMANADVLDATGKLVFPGFIDAHTHLDMDNGVTRTADDFQTGTRAAVAGGTTTIVDFATQDRGRTLTQALTQWHKNADDNCYCDYGFHMAVTDWNPQTAAEIPEMARLGVTSFKVYMAYDNLRLEESEILALMTAVKGIGGLVSCHCEVGDTVNRLVAEFRSAGQLSPKYHPLSRPDTVEAEAVTRFCALGKAANAPVYVVHLSTKAGLEAARRARLDGVQVLLETCPQYLALDDTLYDLPDFESGKYVCSPPLRKQSDQDALWQALRQGNIDTVATDHCSFNFQGQKTLGREDFSKIPNGLPGIEHRGLLLHSLGAQQGLTYPQLSRLLSETPAKLFGMYPQKGVLAVGSDADIVVWNPKTTLTLHAATMNQAVDYTPFEGMEVTGTPELVFLRGHLVAKQGVVTPQAIGQYVPRGVAIL